MTDRTCLDAAAHEVHLVHAAKGFDSRKEARAALDAIHPALADLTPDDVRGIFDSIAKYGSFTISSSQEDQRMWEVLSRD